MSFALIILIILIIVLFLFKNKRNDTSTKSEISLINLNALLTQHISYYLNLSDDQKLRFKKLIEGFLSEINIEGVGTAITDEDRVMIASSAVIPIFGFPEWRYKNLTNIILYPDSFNNDFQFEGGTGEIMGMVGGGYMNGQMLLSRAALVKGFSKNNGKANTALHEFVHLLDNADGATDGVPDALISHDYATPWLQMMHKEMHKIQKGHSDIDPYAITNEAEFLAVASEYFFEKPAQFKEKHPELFDQLCLVFNQDPAEGSIPNQGTGA